MDRQVAKAKLHVPVQNEVETRRILIGGDGPRKLVIILHTIRRGDEIGKKFGSVYISTIAKTIVVDEAFAIDEEMQTSSRSILSRSTHNLKRTITTPSSV